MTESDGRRRHQPEDRTLSDAAAHPEQTVDTLEEQVLGERMDQVRDEDDDETAPAQEQDLDAQDPTDSPGAVEHGPGAEPP